MIIIIHTIYVFVKGTAIHNNYYEQRKVKQELIFKTFVSDTLGAYSRAMLAVGFLVRPFFLLLESSMPFNKQSCKGMDLALRVNAVRK